MIILTFDIEDWFHTHQNRKYYSGHIWNNLPSRVERNTQNILNVLDKHNRKATFFILGWVAEKHPDLVKQIYNKGHEIAAHSAWHHNASLLYPEDFEKDLIRNLDALQNITGEKVIAYRAPGYSIKRKNTLLFDILSKNGITIDSSVQLYNPMDKAPFKIITKHSEIAEFPLIKTLFGFPYGGGGYFRALPEKLLYRYFDKNEYNLLYMHPRDTDVDNPESNIFSSFRNMFNRYNTSNTIKKLEILIQNHSTLSIGESVVHYSNKFI